LHRHSDHPCPLPPLRGPRWPRNLLPLLLLLLPRLNPSPDRQQLGPQLVGISRAHIAPSPFHGHLCFLSPTRQTTTASRRPAATPPGARSTASSRPSARIKGGNRGDQGEKAKKSKNRRRKEKKRR